MPRTVGGYGSRRQSDQKMSTLAGQEEDHDVREDSNYMNLNENNVSKKGFMKRSGNARKWEDIRCPQLWMIFSRHFYKFRPLGVNETATQFS